MEYTATPRRLIRRLIPWTLAMGLFAGGGFGVYSYAVPQSGDESEGASPTAKTRIDKLFASTPAEDPAEAPYGNRYAAAAPQLPLPTEQDDVATPRSAAADTATPNPFATTPLGGYGDRYAAPSASSALPAEAASPVNAGAGSAPPQVSPTEVPSASAAAPPDSYPSASPLAGAAEIARGQEPADENPLRGSSRPTVQSGPADARAAFDQQHPNAQAKTLELGPSAATSDGGVNANAHASVVNPSSASSAATGDSSRYGGDAGQVTGGPAEAAAAFGQDYAGAEPATPTLAEPTLADSARSQFAATPSAQLLRPSSASFAAAERQPAATGSLAQADAKVTSTPGLAAVDGAGRPGERILEGLQNPAITIQKLAPSEIQVGKKCTFAVRVQNNSQRTAHNVQIRDEAPLGTQLIGTAPKANVAGSQVIWDLGTLSPGEERVVEMELMPTNEGELGSVATVTFAAQASAKARCTKPELALRLTAGPRVMIGQQHLVEIEVSNPGSGDATGVMLLESVPAGVSHEAGPSLEFEVGTLKPGQSQRLDLVLTAEEAGRISNVMTARADASLEVQAACEFEIIAPELKLSVEGPGRRYLERPATYTVSIDNPGTASAKEVQLITQLPKGLQFVSANNMGEYDAATHSVHWSLAELPANERGTVELTALPVEPGEHVLEVASRAEQGLEDRAEARVTVEGLVALSFEVEAADGAIEVGGETTYQITVVNQGSKPAANVQVVAAMPEGMRATDGGGTSRHVIQGDRVVFAPLPQLAPKAEAKFQVKVQGLTPGDRRTRIMVMADEVQEPITKEQSTRVYADQ